MQESSAISQLDYRDLEYPSLLREIDNPPMILYSLGTLPNVPLVAIVGSRRPTEYGKQITYQLASELSAAGVGIVSGLAIGIDAVAHQAALDTGGYTLAVLGCGIDTIYPPRNRTLATKILASGGAIISEQPLGMPPLRHNFPARNRIIAGLCLGTIVSEADVKSGSLITASFARDQNRIVMAVPGNITSLRSAGPNNLLRVGAVPLTNSSDALEALNLDTAALPRRPEATPANTQEALILGLLDQGTTTSKELINASGLDAASFARAISLMEITGKVHNLGAGTWVRR